jgi:hypothetical protein
MGNNSRHNLGTWGTPWEHDGKKGKKRKKKSPPLPQCAKVKYNCWVVACLFQRKNQGARVGYIDNSLVVLKNLKESVLTLDWRFSKIIELACTLN